MLKNTNIYATILLAGALSLNSFSYARAEGEVVAPQETTQARVTGTVSDATGPIIGASVLVKGKTVGTVTDLDGKFTLEGVKQGDVIQISYVGYTTQEVTYTGKPLNVTLEEDSKSLEEVVVVGYGTQKKVNLTGAVATVNTKQLESRFTPSLTQALQGTVANLNISSSNGVPGSKQNINIRGVASINGDMNKLNELTRSPLVVVDGIQGAELSNINMNDVESISVLKDASAAAIYGSSAPYGVIIITTKKGRTGKPLISYSNNFGFSQAINLPHYVNSLEFAEAFNEVGANSNYTAKLFNDEVIGRIKDYMSGKLKDETMAKPGEDSWLSWNAANANNDWFDIYFKNAAFSQQHNLGVSGGSETSSYYIGLGYVTQDGLYNWANDSYQRYNVRANLSSNITKWMKFNFRSAFSRETTDTPAIYGTISGGNSYSYDYFHQLGRTYPTVPLKNPDGYYSEGSGVLNFTEGGRAKGTTDDITLTGELVLNPLPGWEVTANYTYDAFYNMATNHRSTFYITKPSGAKQARSGTSPNYFERTTYKNQHHTINAYTSYEKQLGDHYLKGMIGFTQELYDDFNMRGSNNNLYTDEVPMLSQAYGTSASAGDGASQLAIRGGFARINYNYQEKYLLELNGRYDGSSRFTKDVRFKVYPGVSAGWAVSRESFWKPIENYVNHFKLRVSYGSLGDQAFISNRYQFFPALATKTPTNTNYLFSDGRQSAVAQPTDLVNYALTWITTATLNFGFDAGFLNNRLNVSFDWFDRNNKDEIGPSQALPTLLGVNVPPVNNAETETKGFEITIGWKDRIGDFSYGVSAVLGDSRTKITKYNNPTGILTNWHEGQYVGEIWGYETVGLFKTDAEIAASNQSGIDGGTWYIGDVHYKDLDGNGVVNNGKNTASEPGDMKIIGNSAPRYTYGINLNGEWKGLDLSIFLQGVGKRDIMFASNANFFWGFTGGEWQSSYFTEHTDRWTPDNPNGYLPRAYFNSTKNMKPQTRYLQDASYMRIKNMQLGYTLPKAWIQKLSLQKVRFYTSVENLATFTKLFKIIDPEIVNTEAKVYPLQRTWSFGVNVTL